MTFASDEVLPPELSNNFTFGETTYTLYTNSFLNFGQNADQDSLHEVLRSKGSSKNSTLVDPCAPRGYSHNGQVMVRTSGASRSTLENQYVDSGNGNFTECRSTSLLLLQKGKDNCKTLPDPCIDCEFMIILIDLIPEEKGLPSYFV
ncbi:hypothetical protein PVAP13_5KG303700 [Panicum virgatum]|uniref:Uncharacterized protein n=1 Tax=Panicum virgatum TaxID=38727 RepID=A0A8T0SNL3_PANVG|nr:hypothetical protein PVAP13_5KG303700 [Panicum virgatum]